MKKYTIAAMFLAAGALAAAFDPGVIAWDVNPGKIVADQSNRFKDGWVVEEGSDVQYYGNWISYSISVKKEDPSDWYIFYDGLEDKKAFHEFYCDVIKYYSSEAVMILASAWIGNSEVQVSIKILDDKNRSLLIYSKQPSASGIRGFGITHVEKNKGEVSVGRIVGDTDGRRILPLEEFEAKSHETTIAYIDREYLSKERHVEVAFSDPASDGERIFYEDGIMESDDLYVPVLVRWKEGMGKYRSRVQGYIVYNGMLMFLNLEDGSADRAPAILNWGSNVGYRIYVRTTDPEVPSNVPLFSVQVGKQP